MFLVWPRPWVKSKWALYSPIFIRDADRLGWVLSLRIMGLVFMCIGASGLEAVLLGTHFLSGSVELLFTCFAYAWGPFAAFTGWCYAAPRFLQPSLEWSTVPLAFQDVIDRYLLVRIGATVFGIFLLLLGIGATAHIWFGPLIANQQWP